MSRLILSVDGAASGPQRGVAPPRHSCCYDSSARLALQPASGTINRQFRRDTTLGVLAKLEVAAALNAAGVTTQRPLAFAFFSNEEGARFAPDMMGSQVFQGGLALEEALTAKGIDSSTVAENLHRIGYAGGQHPASVRQPRAFVELHVEQGPVLEHEGITIGAVTGVQGIHWTENVRANPPRPLVAQKRAPQRKQMLAVARATAAL